MTQSTVPFSDNGLTPTDYALADLVMLGDQFPGGYQVAMGIRLEKALAAAEKLFAERDLPLREELIAELTLWRCHTEDGLTFMRRTDEILQKIIRGVSAATGARR